MPFVLDFNFECCFANYQPGLLTRVFLKWSQGKKEEEEKGGKKERKEKENNDRNETETEGGGKVP